MNICKVCDCSLSFYNIVTWVLDCEHEFHLRCLHLKNVKKCPTCCQVFSKNDLKLLKDAYYRRLYRIQDSAADSGYESI